jgi:hypothetical protein
MFGKTKVNKGNNYMDQQQSYSPEEITKLETNQIFVFGSNYAGRHGKGAALMALKKFGAIPGQGVGLMGQSYGIATKDKFLKTLPLNSIELQIIKFLKFAKAHPELTFLVTPIGCGLAGLKPKQIAPMFFDYDITPNIILPKVFFGYKEGF